MPRSPPAAASACSSPAWFCTRALGLRLSTSCAATVHPRCCAADTAASQPPAGHCVNARSTVAPEFACTCAQGRTNWGTSSSCRSSARPGTLAAARVPRGWSAEANRPANRPAIPPTAVWLFGRALSRLTGMAHWARGPKARALGGVAERTCAAIRGASVLVNSQQSPLLFRCRCPLPRPRACPGFILPRAHVLYHRRARARARVILGQLHRYRRACCCPVLTFKTSSLGRGEAMKEESMCTICRVASLYNLSTFCCVFLPSLHLLSLDPLVLCHCVNSRENP